MNNPKNFIDPTGECSVDDEGEIKDCDIERPDPETLTNEQEELFEKYLEAIAEVGTTIQNDGTEAQKLAWASITAITFEPNQLHDVHPTAGAYNLNDAITYYEPGFGPSLTQLNRTELTVHEIFHSLRDLPRIARELQIRTKTGRFMRKHYDPDYISNTSSILP